MITNLTIKGMTPDGAWRSFFYYNQPVGSRMQGIYTLWERETSKFQKVDHISRITGYTIEELRSDSCLYTDMQIFCHCLGKVN